MTTTVQDLCKTLQRMSWADMSDSDDSEDEDNIPVAAPAKKATSWADSSDSEDEDDVVVPPKLVRSVHKPDVEPPAILLPSPSLSPVPSDSSDTSEPVQGQPLKLDEREVAREQEMQQKIVHGIRTLIARNLPRDITVHQLRDKFERFGILQDIYVPKNMDRSSPYFGTIKGFALIKFLRHEDALRSFRTLYRRTKFSDKNVFLEFANQDR
jgi:RNA recognition motif-containing protein